MIRRAVREHWRASAIDRRWITEPSAISSHRIYIHRRCLHEHVENIAEVSPICLGHFEHWYTLRNVW